MKVAIGPVFDEFGGVSQHIFGIKRYSSHKVKEVPSKFSRKIMGENEFRRNMHKMIINKINLSSYDIVHSHVDPWFTNLCLLSRTSSCKWVHTYHTLYFEEDYPEGLQEWQKETNRILVDVASKADIRISISHWLHDYLSDRYSIQTEIVPNGFDFQICKSSDPRRFVNKYHLQDFVLFVGNIQPIKNPQLFVEMASLMPNLKFVMIGRNLNPINLIKEYRSDIPKNITLLDEMNHEDVLDAISACKVFVMTSKREGIPTVLLEAMGLGKPVVAPSHSGCKEVIESDDYGFLYEPDSIEDLVKKTTKALTSEYIGESARKKVSEKYDWKIIAKKMDSIYESCRQSKTD